MAGRGFDGFSNCFLSPAALGFFAFLCLNIAVLYSRSFIRACRHFLLLGAIAILCTLAWGSGWDAGWAQISSGHDRSLPVRETLIFDGRKLFDITQVPGFDAEERARAICDRLQEKLMDGYPIDVVAEEQKDGTVKLAIVRQISSVGGERDGKSEAGEPSQDPPQKPLYLMTVTQNDARAAEDSSPLDRAAIWEEKIETAFARALEERTWKYNLRRSIPLSVGALVFGAIAVASLSHAEESVRRSEKSGRLRWLAWLKPTVPPAIALAQWTVWAIVVSAIAYLFPWTRTLRNSIVETVISTLTAIFTVPIVNVGNAEYSFLEILLLVGTLTLLWFGVQWLVETLEDRVSRVAQVSANSRNIVSTVGRYLLLFLGLLAILQSFGIDVSSLAILASFFGVGIGFGLQNIANNFVSGLIVIFERPIKVGDFVQVGDLVGTIKKIGLRSTEITTLDRISLLVPNSRFIEQEVMNWSHGSPVSRFKINVGVAYESDLRVVHQALSEVTENHPNILKEPVPQVWCKGFGNSSIDFEILVWTDRPAKQFKTRSDLHYRIDVSLRKHGIKIPFPQQDLHLQAPLLDELARSWLAERAPERAIPQPPESSLPTSFADIDPILAERSGIDEEDIKVLVDRMRGPDGVEIKDRYYGFNLFSKCFVGTEAVIWLMRHHRIDRESAVRLGQLLIDCGHMHHVTDDHSFRNDRLFYRFYEDEE